jgi:NAD(P)-dependent dehydrogenase (short-subunit alcohol dehydrogenase family)
MEKKERFATYPSLRERVVLITGGATGIGAATVQEFALQGSRVAFLDVDANASSQLIADIAPRCAHAPLFLACDLTDIAALRVAVDRVEATFGAINALVNNAASDDRHSYADVTPEYWDARIAINLRHQFFAIQAVAPRMIAAGGGSIINMSSIGWIIPSTGMPAYVTCKAAIVGLTRTMAHELGKSNIRVNSVLPGAILTERQRRLWWTPQYEAEIMANQALKRSLAPEEVARLILFLAADDGAGITNQSYVIDGGWV